jgi:hypothetical protein
MKPKHHNLKINKAVTLMELFIALILLAIVVIGFSSINTFSRHKLITTERRIKVQNEVSYALEHMSKNIAKAIGSNLTDAINIPTGNQTITVRVDANDNGIPDSSDLNITYSFDNTTHLITFTNLNNPALNTSFTNITNCTFGFGLTNDIVEVDIEGCFDPNAGLESYNTPENPCTQLNTKIHTPSVSRN